MTVTGSRRTAARQAWREHRPIWQAAAPKPVKSNDNEGNSRNFKHVTLFKSFDFIILQSDFFRVKYIKDDRISLKLFKISQLNAYYFTISP